MQDGTRGYVYHISGTQVTLSAHLYLGLYLEFTLNNDFALEPTSDYAILKNWMQPLHTNRDLPVEKLSDGAYVADTLPAEASLQPTLTDASTYMCFELDDGLTEDSFSRIATATRFISRELPKANILTVSHIQTDPQRKRAGNGMTAARFFIAIHALHIRHITGQSLTAAAYDVIMASNKPLQSEARFSKVRETMAPDAAYCIHERENRRRRRPSGRPRLGVRLRAVQLSPTMGGALL